MLDDRTRLAALEERVKAISDLLKVHDRRYTERFVAQNEALRKQEVATKHWQEEANNWRKTLIAQNENYATRAEFAQVKEQLNLMMGRRQGLSAGWGYLLGAIALLSTIIAIVTALPL